MATSIIS